jgi:hypothetical protein
MQLGKGRNVQREIMKRITDLPQGSPTKEIVKTLPAISGAVAPSAISDLTKEEINKIMKMKPRDAEKYLKRKK